MAPDPRRPGFHFTAPSGWINDPLGVSWHDGRYELFYQFNPEAPDWVVACRWGQATSTDLIGWRHARTALEPGPGEDGCWSGSVAVEDDGTPVIVYTSVLADSVHLGRVALATGDRAWSRWTHDPSGPVVGGPPEELDLTYFRDPFVWRSGDGWRMAVGGGQRDGEPVVVQYSSPDLRNWRLDGALAQRSAQAPEALDVGSVWECPQLFPLDGAWVLLVSVWRDEMPAGVAAAVGDYDGRRFTARSWHRLAALPLYATTTFADAAGRRCALSWIHEPGPAAGAWAGTLTVPWLLERRGERVGVQPHPDVTAARTGLLAGHGPTPLTGRPIAVGPVEPFLDVELEAETAGGRMELAIGEAAGELVRLVVEADGDEVQLCRPGRAGERVPLVPGADGTVALRVLLDASVIEVFPGGGGVAAVRLFPSGGPVRVELTGERARLRRLEVHGMPRPLA
jgi:beta-fructofuranosidase